MLWWITLTVVDWPGVNARVGDVVLSYSSACADPDAGARGYSDRAPVAHDRQLHTPPTTTTKLQRVITQRP
jgi:hypothetical protein